MMPWFHTAGVEANIRDYVFAAQSNKSLRGDMSTISSEDSSILIVDPHEGGQMLIDPEMNLEPINDIRGGNRGWRDLGTGLSFWLEFCRKEDVGFDGYNLNVADFERLPRKRIARIKLVLENDESDKPLHISYRVSFCDFINKIPRDDSSASKFIREIVFNGAEEGQFLEYALKMARACHCVFMSKGMDGIGKSYIEVRNLADAVKFTVVE